MFFFFKQKSAYEMRISDWSSDVCSSDLDDEVADAFVIEANPAVIGVDIGGVEIAVREMCQQPGADVLDQVAPGRFDRFEEARGESQRDDIAAPRPLPHPGPEEQRPRLGERPALDVGEQNGRRFVLPEEVAAQ